MSRTNTTTSHLLIPVSGETMWIEPATFYPNGLAVHRTTGFDRRGKRQRSYTVTHVRSGAHIRSRLTRTLATRLAVALQGVDFTFAADAVTAEHAALVREAHDALTTKRAVAVAA